MLPGLARGEFSPEDADDLATLEQGQIERQLGDARGKADDEVAALPADRAQRRLRVIAAYGVENHLGAVRAADRLESIRERACRGPVERHRGVLHGLVGAVFARERELRFARCRGDDARARRLAQLHRGKTDAARGAEYEQGLAGRELRAILERVLRGAV